MSKSRDIADSAATINYIDGLTSDAQTQLDGKATLDASPTFTGTVTATAFSGDGSGLTGVDSLPSQTGNAGNYLTTDGTDASWGAVSAGLTNSATIDLAGDSAFLFTGIPSGVNLILLTFYNLRQSGGQMGPRIALGTSGGLVTSGYRSGASRLRSSTPNYLPETASNAFMFGRCLDTGGTDYEGLAILSRTSNNHWSMTANITAYDGTVQNNSAAGAVSLGGNLTQLNFYNAFGTWTSGTIGISYL